MELATRAAYRGQLTKIVKAVSDYLISPESQLVNDSENDAIEEELNTFLQRLRAVNDSLNTVNRKILEKDLIKADLEQEMTKIAEYEDSAITTITRLESRLKRLSDKCRPPPVTVNAEPFSHQRATQSHTNLPKINLKKFDGNMKDWIPFWEQFRFSVHENVALSGTEKFNYLESCLLGAAKKVIAGFMPSESCYDAAISLLQEQYGDVERLIDNHIQQLVSLRPVHLSSDIHSLRNLYNSITTCRRSLTALNVPSHQYDVMLKSILLRCLPAELRISFHRIKEPEDDAIEKEDNAIEKQTSLSDSSTTSAKRQMHRLMEFLKTEIEAMERSKVTSNIAQRNAERSTTSTAASLVALKENDRCVFCNSSAHNTKDCDSNLSISQKRDILAKNGRCFRCAKRGHSSKKCRSARYIKCNKCKGNHITAMCDPKFRKSSALAVMQDNEDSLLIKEEDCVSSNLMCNSHGAYKNVFLKTARCIAEGEKQKANLLLRIVIDGGSQNTYICESVAKKLELTEIGKIKMAVVPFGSTANSPQKTLRKVLVHLRSQYDNRAVEIEALVVPQICVDLLDAPNEKCESFSKFRLADRIFVENIAAEQGLSMLIGADFYWNVVTGKQRRISDHLKAIETLFGWTMQGRHEHKDAEIPGTGATLFVSKFFPTEEQPCTKDLSAMWALEAIGIQGEEKEKVSLTEMLTHQCIQRSGNRYQASLPWKDAHSTFCGDRNQAIARVDSLVRRLSRDPKRLEEYDTAIQTLVKEGIAEPVNGETSKRIFYLPHHPIYKEDSETTRLRIVFDASFHKECDPSLNSFLVTGTNLLTDVQKILLNFRMGPFALVADIEKAFLQIMLAKEDRDSHRFVWMSSPNNQVYQDYRMTRVTFGVNCSPFLLSATIQHHLEQNANKYPGTCKVLKDTFYMDDLVLSFSTEEEGQLIYRESNEIMQAASMVLRKWHSNSKRVRSLFDVEASGTYQKVLGLIWHVFSDELQVSLKSLHSLHLTTDIGNKRMVLQAIARIYDPLGVVSPTVIKLKILFQSIWKMKLSWDETLPSDLLVEWNDTIKSILQLSDMHFSRSVLPMPATSTIYVHIFADASLKAYGAVAFVKSINMHGEFNVSFLCAKSRVAPLKENNEGELTLPKLELTANLIAARLCDYLQRNLKVKVQRFLLWSDSKIALNWIYGENKQWKPYVQSRVTEIRRLTRLVDWGHCSGKENPADLMTRGITGSKLQTSSIWFSGPEWLRELQDDEKQFICTDDADFLSETVLLTEADVAVPNLHDPVLKFEDFSSWEKLLRITGYVQRFCKACQKMTVTTCVQLTAEELEAAEDYWVRYVQYTAFGNEIRLLQKGQVVHGKSPIAELCPFLDNKGFLRLGGRQQLLDDAFDIKHPKILPPDSRITKLLIEDYHLKTLHGGIGTVLTKLREKFWIPRGRQLVKKLGKKCITCKKLFGPSASQPFAPLPKERITLTRPFDNVGIDFAGPLFYTTNTTDVMQKSYLMIITCAAVRAVHLELVVNMTTEACLMALRRFIARRGVPSSIFSDNAKTFRRAALELNEVGFSIDDDAVRGLLSQKRIKWQFIAERAPWWGGFWERLIRTIKNTLKTVIGRAKLNFDQLRTFLTEAEAIVNDRPITYVSSEPLDLMPISPSKFLSIAYPGGKEKAIASETNSDLQELWKHRIKYTQKMWNRWRVEYLQTLRLFHTNNTKSSLQLKEDDVVLLFDNAKPRVHWKLAVIEKTFPGRDGRVRSCEIRCADAKVFRRPIQLLYPLELGPAEGVEN